MKGSPRITVLMPVYNGEKYLQPAIESILSQTFMDFELLIIDDGSTDHSREICRSYGDDRIRLVENGQNLGLIRTLNKGFVLADGDYIARMDCDDVSAPQRFEKQIMFMDEHPDIGICGTWYEKVEPGRSVTMRFPTEHRALQFFMLFDNPFLHSTMFIRRGLLEKHALCFDSEALHAEDYEFWARCSEVTGIANLPEVLLRYRSHPENVSNRFQGVQWATADRVRRRQLANLGLPATESEIQLHNNIAKFECHGQDGRPDIVQAWLEKLVTLGAEKCGIPTSAVYRHLARYWYGVCGNFAHEGLRTWRLFLSSPIGRAAEREWQWKLLMRCLLRRDIAVPPMEPQS